MRTLLPRQGVPIADGGGMASNPFYAFLQDVERAINSGAAGGDGLADAVAAIARALGSPDGSVANIPEQSQGGGQILGPQSVHVNGALPNMVQIVLEGDAADPGPTFRYGTDAEGAKGWFPIADALAGSGTATLTVGADGVVTFSLPELPDAGTGTFKLLARDQYGRLSGTADGTTGDVPEGSNLYHTAARVRATVLTGLSTATNAVIAATDTVLGALGRLQAQITGLASTVSDLITQSITNGDTTHAPSGDAVDAALAALIPPGYIDGLQMVWVSGTALTVTSGAASIESGGVLKSPTAIAKAGLSLSASAWYHVYLFDNAGTPDIEIVTTAPVAAYSGTARSKAGDTSRRYLGSVKTSAAGAIHSFQQSGTLITYVLPTGASPFRALSGGSATTFTSVSIAAVAPVTSRNATLFIQNINATLAMEVGVTALIATINPTGAVVMPFPLSVAQTMVYRMLNVAASAYIDVLGYTFER